MANAQEGENHEHRTTGFFVILNSTVGTHSGIRVSVFSALSKGCATSATLSTASPELFLSRPVVVYLVMIVVLVAGLWTVLDVGGHLIAPEDLAGKWQVQSADGDPRGPGLNIEQSGKFFQIAFEHGPQLDLKLQSTSPTVLANGNWKMTITGREGGDDKTLQLEGPQAGRWSAHRTVRTFASDVNGKGAP
jgi:hypothetical protein